MSLSVVVHPVLDTYLAEIRATETTTPRFRELLERISVMLAIEASRKLATKPITITTPLAQCEGRTLSITPIIAPVLRAGLGFVDGFLQILPTATIAHLGFFRDPQSMAAVPYYANLPDVLADRDIFLLDPMLATGNSAKAAIELLISRGATRITLIALVAAQAGIDAIQSAYPDIDIVTAAVDPDLNEHGYIVPGLGDAGDRQFGTDRSTPITVG